MSILITTKPGTGGGGSAAGALYTSSVVNNQSSAITSTSFVNFSNSPALTFTPTVSGIYKIYSNVPNEVDSLGAFGIMQIVNTSGGATLVASSQTANFVSSGADVINTTSVVSYFTLVAGTSYVFDLQGKLISAGGTFYTDGQYAPFYMFGELIQVASGAASTGITRLVSSISTPTAAGSTAFIDYVYLVSGTTTLTLPTAVGNTNLYTVKNTGVNTVSIATTSAQTIDGSASPITLPVANTSLDLISDGSNWRII